MTLQATLSLALYKATMAQLCAPTPAGHVPTTQSRAHSILRRPRTRHVLLPYQSTQLQLVLHHPRLQAVPLLPLLHLARRQSQAQTHHHHPLRQQPRFHQLPRLQVLNSQPNLRAAVPAHQVRLLLFPDPPVLPAPRPPAPRPRALSQTLRLDL
ncbi:hypothetical protein C8R45DRAFT_1000894 [Mycena sanguinolenta]|nr:hypothetical protein C8R45DRAFT_1000894 [Mycena sanguinolenta]